MFHDSVEIDAVHIFEPSTISAHVKSHDKNIRDKTSNHKFQIAYFGYTKLNIHYYIFIKFLKLCARILV